MAQEYVHVTKRIKIDLRVLKYIRLGVRIEMAQEVLKWTSG